MKFKRAFEGAYTLHYAECKVRANFHAPYVLGGEYKNAFFVSRNGRLAGYYAEEEMKRLRLVSYSLLVNKSFREQLLTETKRACNAIAQMTPLLVGGCNKVDNNGLAIRLEIFRKEHWLNQVYFVSSMPTCTYLLEIELEQFLKKRVTNKKKRQEYLIALTTPSEETALNREVRDYAGLVYTTAIALGSIKVRRMSFRNFARMIEKNYPSVLDKITDLLRDYRWLPTQEGNPPLTRLYYLRALYQDLQRPFPKLKEDFKLQREVLKKFDRQRHSVERELQMPSKIRYLAATVRILAKIRMDVRLARTESDFLGRSLRMEIAKRLRMSSYELEFLTTNELTAALRGKKVDRQQLEKRKNFYVWEIKDGKESIHTGKVARSVLTVLLDQEKNIQASNEIAGLAASPGKVRGIVKIISPLSKKQYKDCEEMKQGQILVTGQTRPHLMVAVRKAAAIVTDEGGMSSHSALVSREFGIPCVVGTHNATKLLHDGDLVEVDAFAGKVNIIQKKP